MKKIFISLVIITAIALAIAVITLKIEEKEYSALQIREQFANKLESLVRSDGSFLYEYNIEHKNEIDDYNILRHSLSSYALINYYEENDLLKSKRELVERMLEYIKEQIVEDNNGNMYVADIVEDEIKLGACALGLLNFCEYERLYNDERYHDVCIKLANGILTMQRLDGRFSHIYNPNTFKLKEKDRIIYYEGEACFALCKAYGLLKDEKYLTAVNKAVNYYCRNGYSQYNDHWQEHAVFELSKYVEDDEYLEYGVKNVTSKLTLFKQKDDFANTDFELFNTCLKLIDRVGKEKYASQFDAIDEELTRRKNILVNEYNKIVNDKDKDLDNIESFLKEKGKNHLRIDDLAHYIIAFS